MDEEIEIKQPSNWKRYIITFIIELLFLGIYFNNRNILTNKPGSFSLIYVFIFLLVETSIYLIIKALSKREYNLEKIFVLATISLGIIYTLLIPIGIVPDEWAHMENTFSLSSQILGKEIDGKCSMRASEYELYTKQISAPDNNYYDYVYSNIFSISHDNSYVTTANDSFSIGQLFAYFPSVIGITLGRILSLGAVTTVYLGRLANFSFYITLTYFALKKIPFGKVLMFAITMLPMTCQQMFSLSYDAVINSSAFFCISYGLFFVYQSQEVKLKDFILYSLSGLLLLANKGSAYAFILIIPIMAKYFNPNGEKVAKKTKIIVLLMVLISIILLNYHSLTDSSQVSAVETVSQGLVPWSGTPSHTISSMLKDIPGSIMLFINTFIQKGWWYMSTAIGSELGWLTIMMPTAFTNIWLTLLICSALSERSNKEVFTSEHKTLFFLIALAVIMIVMLAMALAWTPLEYTVIEGVQGRYYIPILFLLFIILMNSKIYLKEGLVKILICSILIMTVVSFINLMPLVL